jgi:hypothetical protein
MTDKYTGISYEAIDDQVNKKFKLIIEFPLDSYSADVYNLVLGLLDFSGAKINGIIINDR